MESIDIATTDNIYDLIFVNDSIAYLCGGILWESGVIAKSSDGGLTWTVQQTADNVLYKVAFKNVDEGIAVGFSGRVWKTVNGGNNWELSESSPNYPVFTDAVFLNDNKVIMSAGYSYYFGGFASYFFYGPSFNDSIINQDMESVYFFNEQEGLIAGYGVVYKTFDGGKTWQGLSVDGDFFKDITFNASNEGLLIGYRGKIFTSKNSGDTWEKSDRKASFFTTKGNLEDADLNDRQAFVCGQNAVLYYADNFFEHSWSQVDHPFSGDFLNLTLKNDHEGFVTGENGLIIKFVY